jgi:hypothetical protein
MTYAIVIVWFIAGVYVWVRNLDGTLVRKGVVSVQWQWSISGLVICFGFAPPLILGLGLAKLLERRS